MTKLLFVLAALLSLASGNDFTSMHFWKTKPDVYKKIKEDRAIIVSARNESIEEGGKNKEVLKVTSVGWVKSSFEFTKKTVQAFELLPKVDERFLESKFNSSKSELFVHLAAYGYHAKMLLKLVLAEKPGIFDIQYECIEGAFQGMTGLIRIEDQGRQASEISMTAFYKSDKLPLPSVLMGIGLEFVAQRVSSQMRNYIEDEYKKR